MMRSDSGKDSSGVTIFLGLGLGLETCDIGSRLDSLGVCTLGRGNILRRRNRLGDRLGLLNFDSLGNTRWSALGRLRSMSMTMTECTLVDRFREW